MESNTLAVNGYRLSVDLGDKAVEKKINEKDSKIRTKNKNNDKAHHTTMLPKGEAKKQNKEY